ncbi:GntR family transcriptional regulator [Streptomyces globisporus]|uniref:GntR family transcriptional regulator n=1 Tax=Streptomyces globisporus TaxID=1908 RepID=UPI0037B89B0B
MSRAARIQIPTIPKPGTLGRRVYDGLDRLLDDADAYPPGTKLPTYRALSQQYGVALSAVGAAMEALASQGRVCIRPSNGVLVLGEDHEPASTKAVLIATAARERIADRTLTPGASLVPLLADEFAVGESTVMIALRLLADEGLVVVKTGSGTYGSPRRAPERGHHHVHPPSPDTTQTPVPALLASRATSDRRGVRTTSSQDIPVVSPHLVGTSPKLHAARAAYEQVVDMLADTDTYPPGSTLPAQTVLADRLGVTRYALRAVMNALEADGRIRRRAHATIVLGKDSTPVAPTTARITGIVRARIQDGTIQPGEQVSVPLVDEFGVGTATVNRALAPLVAEGILVVRQGVGTFVPRPSAEAPARTGDRADTTRRTTDAARQRTRAAAQ